MWRDVPFGRQRRPIIGVLRMCWLLPGSFDCFCPPPPPRGNCTGVACGPRHRHVTSQTRWGPHRHHAPKPRNGPCHPPPHAEPHVPHPRPPAQAQAQARAQALAIQSHNPRPPPPPPPPAAIPRQLPLPWQPWRGLYQRHSTSPRKELWAIARVHKRRSAQKRRQKTGPSVAYKTRGAVLCHRRWGSGQAPNGGGAPERQRHATGRREAVPTGPAISPHFWRSKRRRRECGWALPPGAEPPPPPCDIPSGGCFFTGPWAVTRSSLRMLRRVAAFCRPLRPVLLLVSFPRSRSPVVGVPGLCWMWRGVPFACQRRPVVGQSPPERAKVPPTPRTATT